MDENTYVTKQSRKYVMFQLVNVQIVFLVVYVVLAILSAQLSSSSANDSADGTGGAGFNVGAFDVVIVTVLLLVQIVLSVSVYLRWKAAKYVITAKELGIVSGIVYRHTKSIELAVIAGCASHRGLVGALMKYSDVVVETRNKLEITLPAVPEPDEFIRQIYRRIDSRPSNSAMV